MNNIRLQIACLCFAIFISVMFFSVRRISSKVHVIYSYILTANITNLVFDMITIYTVNHIDSVPNWINRMAHQIFIGSINCFLCLLSVYVLAITKESFLQSKTIAILWLLPFIISTVATVWMPIYYRKTPNGNYSYGPMATTCYVSVALYFILSFSFIIYHWKGLEIRKRNVIFCSLSVMVVVSLLQAIYPVLLISGMAITLISLAIFLTIENPDRVLMELYDEQKRKANAANSAKSMFLAKMSHEIRTPINAVLGMNEMILRESKEEDIVDYASNIKIAGNTLLALINEILDLSKIESEKMSIIPVEYELKQVLNEIVQLIEYKASDKQLDFSVVVDKEVPNHLFGDDFRLKQVLINLLTNAVKYTHQGSVSLEIKRLSQYSNEVDILFVVKDTGIGIKEEDLKRLASDFERIDEERNRYIEGTGLGMYISAQILKKLNSEIKVKSVYNEGSEFSFAIKQKVVENVPINEFNKNILMNDKYDLSNDILDFIAPDAKLLIVDDNDMNLRVTKALLKNTKIQIETKSNGQGCIDIVKENNYDLIFLDHMMADMDGCETLRKLKELPEYMDQLTPVIIFTANAILGAKEEYLEMGFSDFLSKPVELSKLYAILKKYIPKEKQISIEKTYLDKADKKTDWMQKSLKNKDVERAMKQLGGKAIYHEVANHFVESIQEIVSKVKAIEADKNWNLLRIEIHSLKSTVKMLGDSKSAKLAQEIETNLGENQLSQITYDLEMFYERIEGLEKTIHKLLKKESKQGSENVQYEIIDYCTEILNLKEFLVNQDLDHADQWVSNISKTDIQDSFLIVFKKLKMAISDVDFDLGIRLCETYLELFSLSKQEVVNGE